MNLRYVHVPQGAARAGYAVVENLEVREVPREVSDQDLSKILDGIGASGKFLTLQPEGPEGQPRYSIHYLRLLKNALTRRAPLPSAVDVQDERRALTVWG